MENDEEVQKILDRIRKDRGVVQKSREIWARYNCKSLDLYHQMFMHVIEEQKTIDRKTKELIIIAIDAANLYETGLKYHFDSALRMGITPEEIFETLETASVVCGVHVLAVALPILQHSLEERAPSANVGTSAGG